MDNNFDLFTTPELLPVSLQKALIKAGEVTTYNQCALLQKKCEKLGYTFDFYLDAIPYNLRPIGESKN